MAEIGDECPSCREAGRLYLRELFVRCDNCDFERYSTQNELDTYVNSERYKKDGPAAERLVTLIEPEPVIERRTSRPMGMNEFEIRRSK